MAFKLKQFLKRAFREILLHHHNSLEFRAKLFAAIIAANPDHGECEQAIVLQAAENIYKEEERAGTLLATVNEYLQKIEEDNGLAIDELIEDILKDYKEFPRYADKITIDDYHKINLCCQDPDSKAYQERIITFYQRTKDEYENRRKNK